MLTHIELHGGLLKIAKEFSYFLRDSYSYLYFEIYHEYRSQSANRWRLELLKSCGGCDEMFAYALLTKVLQCSLNQRTFFITLSSFFRNRHCEQKYTNFCTQENMSEFISF
jgi:hypothetical protein